MANQLDLSNVLYINSNPLKVAETYSLLTSDILVYAINSPQLYPGINTVTQYYNNTSNQLAFISYYSTKNINTLLAAANVNGTSLVKVPIRAINGVPFGLSIDYLFPANGIQLKEITPTVTEVYFKNSAYLTDTPIANIIAAANTGGGGGGTNPTNLFIPYNDAGVFEDSYLKNDTTVGAETLSSIFGGETKGLKFEFWDSFYAFGDFGWADNGTSFIIDDAAKVVKTFFQGSDVGLKLDFASKEYSIGNTSENWGLKLNGNTGLFSLGDYTNQFGGNPIINVDSTNNLIFTKYQGNDIGLRLDFANQQYIIGDNLTLNSASIFVDGSSGYISAYEAFIGSNGLNVIPKSGNITLGDFGGVLNQTQFLLDDATAYIKSSYQGNDIGLKLDFGNNAYYFGNQVQDWGVKLDGNIGAFTIGDYAYQFGGNPVFTVDATNNLIFTTYGGNKIGLNLNFGSNVFWFGDVLDIGTGTNITLGNSIGNSLITLVAGNTGNVTAFEVNDTTKTIKSNYGGSDLGLKLDFTGYYYLGDYASIGNKTKLVVSPLEKAVYTGGAVGDKVGLMVDFGSDTYTFSYDSETYFGLDGPNFRLMAGNQLKDNTGGRTFMDECLKINISGADYWIPLYK